MGCRRPDYPRHPPSDRRDVLLPEPVPRLFRSYHGQNWHYSPHVGGDGRRGSEYPFEG